MREKEIRRLSLQSSVEYMTTYFWAILIIAVVLIALWSIGLFNLQGISPKANGGACYINRPNGPNTIAFISLGGVCSAQLPRFAAQFDGSTSYVSLPSVPVSPTAGVSIMAWIQPVLVSGRYEIVDTEQGTSFYVQAGSLCISISGVASHCSGALSAGRWYFVAATYDGASEKLYISGALSGSFAAGGNPTVTFNNGFIGASSPGNVNNFNGMILNVQAFNGSISSNDMMALYSEGIGGNPLNIKNMVAWWQLNGDTKDWSGNMFDGTPTGLVFNGKWYNSYSQGT